MILPTSPARVFSGHGTRQVLYEMVVVSPENGTVAWPGEIDLDPDVLYAQATGKGKPTGDTRAA